MTIFSDLQADLNSFDCLSLFWVDNLRYLNFQVRELIFWEIQLLIFSLFQLIHVQFSDRTDRICEEIWFFWIWKAPKSSIYGQIGVIVWICEYSDGFALK